MSTPETVINHTQLANGLVVVSEHISTARSVYFSFYVKAGSRNESEDINGAAHFLEHMFFKGTASRSAYEIAGALEDLGGSLNAYTGKELTVFYANVLSEHIPMAVDIISDMLCNSLFDEDDIEHEKQVVLEEINAVKDSPEEYIFDLFQEQMFPGQSLGRPILGSEKTITRFDRQTITAFKNRYYVSNKLVISAAGNLNHNDLVKMVEDKFCFAQSSLYEKETAPMAFKKKRVNYNQAANQIHICAGVETVSYQSEKKYDLIALNTYLGGGMSSRLFQKIREEYGYAYTVYSSTDFYRDTGIISFYLGTNRKYRQKALDILKEEVGRVSKKKLSDDTAAKIKMQMKGGFLLGLEDNYNRMSRLAKNEIYHGRQQDVGVVLDAIDNISADSMLNTAAEILSIDEFNIIQIS